LRRSNTVALFIPHPRKESPVASRIRPWAFVALFAAPLFAFGGYSLTTEDEVTCDGEPMRETDYCATEQYGETTYRTYDEQRSDNTTGGYVLYGVGFGAAVFGTLTLVLTRGRKGGPAAPMHAHSGAHPAMQGYPGAHPQQAGPYPPPGQFPPPGVQQPQGFPPQQPALGQWQHQPPPPPSAGPR
jgi:hypothetical protein